MLPTPRITRDLDALAALRASEVSNLDGGPDARSAGWGSLFVPPSARAQSARPGEPRAFIDACRGATQYLVPNEACRLHQRGDCNLLLRRPDTTKHPGRLTALKASEVDRRAGSKAEACGSLRHYAPSRLGQGWLPNK